MSALENAFFLTYAQKNGMVHFRLTQYDRNGITNAIGLSLHRIDAESLAKAFQKAADDAKVSGVQGNITIVGEVPPGFRLDEA